MIDILNNKKAIPQLKFELADQRHKCRRNKKLIHEILQILAAEYYSVNINKLISRYKKSFDRRGDYVEKKFFFPIFSEYYVDTFYHTFLAAFSIIKIVKVTFWLTLVIIM